MSEDPVLDSHNSGSLIHMLGIAAGGGVLNLYIYIYRWYLANDRCISDRPRGRPVTTIDRP